MSAGGGKKAVVAALAANLGIAAMKFVAWLVTGASSMLAEAIHSVADSGNQGLLLRGGQRAKQPSNLRFGRKERVADHHGEEGEDQEVVELEPVADDNRDNRFHGQNWLDA